jgi:trans-2,3-dihydro-3-hydroxyanthranilate isomerase
MFLPDLITMKAFRSSTPTIKVSPGFGFAERYYEKTRSFILPPINQYVMNAVPYHHVDVFSPEPFKGNGLIVFTATAGFTSDTMQVLTREMRQFESIFLQEINGNRVRARILACEEELQFAGHPVLGPAATLHDLHKRDEVKVEWRFELTAKTVTVITEKKGERYEAIMN